MICPKCFRPDAKAVGSVKGRKRFSCSDCGSGYIDVFSVPSVVPAGALNKEVSALTAPTRITEDPPALTEVPALNVVLGVALNASIEEIEGALKRIMDLRLWAIVKNLYPLFEEDSLRVADITGIDPWTVEELAKITLPDEIPAVMQKAPPKYMKAEMPKIDKDTYQLSPSGYEMAKAQRMISAPPPVPKKQLEYNFCSIDDL